MSPDPGACTLRVATPDLEDKVYAASHSLWGAGLAAIDYRDMWRELAGLPWARARFQVLVWTDDGRRVVSSLKVYHPKVRIGGSRGSACGIGAVFTPREHRGRGHARAMLRRVLENAAAGGEALGLLFSDIDPGLYESLGFRCVEAEEAVGTLRREARAERSSIRLRPLRADDLQAVKEAHDATSASRPFAVERDLDHWRFLIARSEAYFRRLDGSESGRRFQIAERAGEFAGYLVALSGDSGWEVREVGAIGGDPSLLASVARAGALQAREEGMRNVRGWLPREWRSLVPEWRLRFERRNHAVPMVRPLAMSGDTLDTFVPPSTFLPYLDQF